MKYDLRKLAQRQGVRRRGMQQLPIIQESPALAAEYLKALRQLLRLIASAVREDVLPVVANEIAAKRRAQGQMVDVDGGLFERIRQMSNALAAVIGQQVAEMMALEAGRHTSKFMAQAKRTLGVDLSAVVSQEDLRGYLETAATRNASLIRGLGEDAIKRVQNTVTTAVIQGVPVRQLRSTLAEDFGFADRRAQLIARDQTAKLNSDLNRIRHEEAGITQYVWRTAHDERVRPLHKRLDGKVYTYGKPTGAEGGLPPGQPVRCRCIAQAIVEF